MADANGAAQPPAAAASSNGEPASSAGKPLPTPEELLRTFEALRDEHRAESENIARLTAQLNGQMALVFLADETKIHLQQYHDAMKALPAGLVGPALLINMRKKLWDSALTLQNGGLHKQAAEIFVSLLGDVQAAYADTEPTRLAEAYLQTAKSLTALDLLPRATQLVELAQEIEKNVRRDIVKRNLGLCANQGCSKKGENKCGACNKTTYCSKDCQKADWRRRHKVLCTASDAKSA